MWISPLGLRALTFLFAINWNFEHPAVRTSDPFALYCDVRAKNVCLRLFCLHVAFPIFRHMNVDFCYQNCTVATNKSCGWLYQSTWGGTQAPHLRMVCWGLVLVVQANPITFPFLPPWMGLQPVLHPCSFPLLSLALPIALLGLELRTWFYCANTMAVVIWFVCCHFSPLPIVKCDIVILMISDLKDKFNFWSV